MILFEYAFIYFKHYHEKDRLILSAARGSLQVISLISSSLWTYPLSSQTYWSGWYFLWPVPPDARTEICTQLLLFLLSLISVFRMQSNRAVDGTADCEMAGQTVQQQRFPQWRPLFNMCQALAHLALKGNGRNTRIGLIYVPPKTHPWLIQSLTTILLMLCAASCVHIIHRSSQKNGLVNTLTSCTLEHLNRALSFPDRFENHLCLRWPLVMLASNSVQHQP